MTFQTTPRPARAARNFISLAGAELASKLLTFAAFAYLARIGGPDGFGYVEFAGAALLCAGLVVDQGFGPYGAREIAQRPEHTARLVGEIIAARAVLAIAAYAAVLTFALLLDRPPIVTRLLLINGLSLFAMPWLLAWVFQGHERMPTVATMQVIRQTVFAVLIFTLVHDARHIWLAAVAEVGAVCSAAAYTVVMYHRHFGEAARVRLRWSPKLLREGVPIGVSQMFWVMRMSGATLLLGVIASAQDVGFFAGALRLLLAAHTFVWLYYFNLLPAWSRAWTGGAPALAAMVERSLYGVAWATLAIGLVWIATADAVITTVYGAAFAPAAAPLQWLCGVCAVAALSGHYRFALIAAGRQTAEMWSAVLGAVVAAMAIPTGYAAAGVAGGAIGLLVAEIVVWLSTWWCARRMLELTGHARLLVGPLSGAVLTGTCLWSLRSFGLGGRIVAAAVLVVLTLITLDDTARQRVWHGATLLRRHGVDYIGTGLMAIWRR